jgi:LacI family transcriptional regulator
LNDQPDVKATTKEKVLKVIEDLNYVPNNSARNLKRHKTNHIGIFVIGEYSTFFSKVIQTIEKEVSKLNYSIVLHFHKNNIKTLESAVQFALEKRLVGLIFLGGGLLANDEGYINQLDIPIVFGSTVLNDEIDQSLYNSVTINNFESAFEGMLHLIKAGHKKIGLITTNDGKDNVAEKRYQAYLEVLKQHDITYDKSLVAIGDYSIESGYNAMQSLLNKDVTAIFAIADLMAIGAIKAISDSGQSVPKDISVLGFDGLEVSKYMTPSLTTIEQPTKEMGEVIGEVILNQLNGHDQSEHIILETSFYNGQTIKELEEA